jgi:hypothetical protein
MPFQIGQKVCLWHVHLSLASRGLIILREVIVTITEVKTGVPGHFSRKPVSWQSLRGIDEHGKMYEKHWDSWPESQTMDFTDQWSGHTDTISTGVGTSATVRWIPKEAVSVYGAGSKIHKPHPLPIIDESGNPMKPKGDIEYCEKHDWYEHRGNKCWQCFIEKVGKRTSNS